MEGVTTVWSHMFSVIFRYQKSWKKIMHKNLILHFFEMSAFWDGINKHVHNHDENCSHPSVLFTVASETNKNKNENMEYLGTFIPLKSRVHSKPGSPIFQLFRSYSLVVYLYVWVKSKFSDNYSLPVLVNIQRLYENSKWFLGVSNRAKWLNVCLWTR